MKRMLFNATQSEELRVAIVDGQKLIDLDIESAGKEQRKSNIYKGIITRIEPSLEAAFVNYGTDRHGFLPFKEVSRSYFAKGSDQGKARIQDVLKEGQELIVQVDKDERGNKGAALTTFISLAGRYLVLMPNNPRGGGVSRRIEGEDRNELREVMSQLDMPKGMSVIARTAGIGRNAEELQWDLNYLTQLWTAIEKASNEQKGAFLIYQEGSLVIRAIRDYFSSDIGEILIDTNDIYEQAVQFMNHVMPSNVSRVKLYQDETPLFSRFQIEHQIETAFSREVRLPSGGAIVIDHTEALVSVDVNSGRSTKGADIEHTAFNTNLEAADEVARQLRLRDLGGLVVIDFIDMESQRHQRDVEIQLRDALHIDRARVQTGKISRFGLLELSRQRLGPSLGESNHIPCPRCHGTGHIRGIESTALHILRITQEESLKDNTKAVQVQLPVDAATFLLNEKRTDIHKIEELTGVEVVLIPNIHLETPNCQIIRIKSDDSIEDSTPSYQMVELPTEEEPDANAKQEPKAKRAEAAVKGITPQKPAPLSSIKESAPEKKGLFSRIIGLFSAPKEAEDTKKTEETKKKADEGRNNRNRSRNRNRNKNRNNNGQERNNNEANQRNAKANTKSKAKPEPKEKVDTPAATEGNGEQRTERTRRSRNGRRNNRGDRNNNAATDTQKNVETAAPVVETTDAPVVAEAPAKPTAKTSRRKPAAKDTTKETVKETKAESEAKSVEAVEVKAAPKTDTKVSDATEEKAPTAKAAAKPKKEAKPAAEEVKEKTAAATEEATAKKTRKPSRPRKAAAAKPVDLAASGLQLVETKGDAKVAKAAPAEAPAKKPRKSAAWQKKAAEAPKEEALVIVQTQK